MYSPIIIFQIYHFLPLLATNVALNINSSQENNTTRHMLLRICFKIMKKKTEEVNQRWLIVKDKGNKRDRYSKMKYESLFERNKRKVS